MNRSGWRKNNNKPRTAAALLDRGILLEVPPNSHSEIGGSNRPLMEMQASSSNGAAAASPACASPTVLKVARSHAWDWVALVLLVVLEVLLNIIEPFHRFVGADMMTDLRYPLKSNTVPIWAVPIYAVIGPMIIFTLVYIRGRNVYDLHHAMLGVICNGDPSVIKEGYKSFPSGHSSWSFAGLGFLSWYLAGKITVFDRRGHVAKLCIVLMPLLLAVMVAISRVDDYWHHWQDVCTGGILGLVVASVCYLQFFPPPSDEKGFWPHAHFRFIIERERERERERESQTLRDAQMSNTRATANNSLRAQLERRTSDPLDALEAGRGNE
ncbi:hypothetical protein PR202_ga10218 [Eleusine coracana subsp. coracana]|uniref:Phosphatidic acid phosphatase type 2/haloperoxidase domain-containing protein n=1 Tax=Eleusine coracana subsp. coracana TaxID=191504 RepID=A0AAV5C650_ELECO|nr:hypothetical protein PR202_ga10218 [Eleusine coracana subsp. coracana]